jgi:hypothetical protein
MAAMARQTEAQAAAILRAIVEAVDRGEMDVADPRSVAVLRRLQGATSALETVAGLTAKGAIDAREPLR